jgi:glycosyltransferase involved in cell wall biosynthesis
MENTDKMPVLWTTSKRSGALFQGPLLTALNVEGAAAAVTAKASPIRAEIAGKGHLLADVSTPTDALALAAFPWVYRRERDRLRAALTERASVVHITMNAPWDVFYLPAAKGLGIPIVQTIHDAVRHPGEESALLDWIERQTMSFADHIVTFSRFVYDSLMERGSSAVPIHLIEGGLLTRTGDPISPRVRTNSSIPRLLFLGRIQAYKGLDILIGALTELRTRGIPFQLVVAGGGDLSPYSAGIADLGDVEVINRWISDEEITKILVGSDVMVMPYVEASQSGVAIDALWAALPTVATPVGALPQQFADGKDALIASEVSVNAVGEALMRVLGDPSLYEKLSRGAYESYQRIGIRPVAKMWRAFYSDIGARSGDIL